MIPMTGVTLPFVSYGGSSIISSLVMFALINGMYNMRQDEGEAEHGKGKTEKENQRKGKRIFWRRRRIADSETVKPILYLLYLRDCSFYDGLSGVV